MRRITGLCIACCCLFTTAVFAEAPEAAIALPTFGLKVIPPAGWVAVSRDKPRTAAQWAVRDAKTGAFQKLLIIEAAKPKPGSDAKSTATAMAKNWGGTLSNDPTQLDGEQAWHVRVERPGQGLQPVEAVIAFHADCAYLIMGGVTPGQSCRAEVESLRASWKWIELELPVKHLECMANPIPVFDGTVVMNYPTLMHEFEPNSSKIDFTIGIRNLKEQRTDFLFTAQLMNIPGGVDFIASRDALGQGIQAKFNLKQPFVWREVKALTQRSMTQPVLMPAEVGGSAPSHLIWGLIKVDANRVVLINFSIVGQSADDLKTYEQTVQSIVESVTQLPPAKQQRRASR